MTSGKPADPLRAMTILACIAVGVASAAAAAVTVNFVRDQDTRDKVSPCVGPPSVSGRRIGSDGRQALQHVPAVVAQRSVFASPYVRSRPREHVPRLPRARRRVEAGQP